MTFDYSGYDLQFIQKRPIHDSTAHLFTLIYKFYSSVTRYVYILHADYHREDVFAVKFYCKKDRHSDYKYSKIINRGDLGNILITCAKVIPLLLKDYPAASFGFAGARTYYTQSGKVESYNSNQRFRIYKYLIALKFGAVTFAHYEYPAISSYLLINKFHNDIEAKERALVKMFFDTYQTLPDVI